MIKEKEVKKRRWVLIAAPVFFVILFVLTLFSNHIMNRMLPEVATQNVQPGTITARVRGTGIVEANEAFEVMTTQTRTVNEVRVRLGDEISTGDILFVLQGGAGEELEMAREQLHELEVALERMLLEDHGDEALIGLRRSVLLARDALTSAQSDRNAIQFDPNALSAARVALNNANGALTSLRADALRAETNLNLALDAVPLDEYGRPDQDHPNYAQAIENVENAQAALLNIQISIQNYEDVASNAREIIQTQESHAAAVSSADERVRDAQRSLDFATEDLSIAQRDDPLFAIQIREQERAIELKRAEVDELEQDGTGSEVTSPVNGIVSRINITPGNVVEPETPLVVIEVTDRGFSLELSVPAEQATRLVIGDNAEVDRGFFWWGDEVRAVLTSIRNDPQDPVARRLLSFDIIGDIESGTQLNLTIAQRSETYSMVVPNIAVRSDTSGSFVLAIEAQTTPLGNRFIATRADVNVIASDDTHSAVSGMLTDWGLVVTTTTEPVEPGMQVRLAG